MTFLPKDLCAKVQNIISKGDGIYLINPIGYLKYLLGYNVDIEWLECMGPYILYDHFFARTTYTNRLEEEFKEFFQEETP